jgi:hypothetical protein
MIVDGMPDDERARIGRTDKNDQGPMWGLAFVQAERFRRRGFMRARLYQPWSRRSEPDGKAAPRPYCRGVLPMTRLKAVLKALSDS